MRLGPLSIILSISNRRLLHNAISTRNEGSVGLGGRICAVVKLLQNLRGNHAYQYIVMAMLETRPKTTRQIADHIRKTRLNMTNEPACNRAYQCLYGLVKIEAFEKKAGV